ncbi:MAG: aa3-type cytochrome oxidase subunit IV [Acidimicrobiales bacterium]
MADSREVAGSGHASPRVDDAVVPRRVFLAIGVLVAVMAAIYWFTAYEDAGTVLLTLSAVLALWCGVFLWLGARPRSAAAAHEAADADAEVAGHYLPHASVWPFAIGLGAALILNGLVLGIWVVVPGVGLMALGTIGFVRQTRRRD